MTSTEGPDGWVARFAGELARSEQGVAVADRLIHEAAIGDQTTYRVGGRAALGVVVEAVDELAVVGRVASAVGVPVAVVGRGSNLLVADGTVQVIAVQLGEGFGAIEIGGPSPDGTILVRAGAAALLPVVARRTVAAGLAGFEWAVGVPGSIGGAVRMNAGGHGSDMAASLRRVRVVDLSSGEDVEMHVAELDLGYRHSALGMNHVVCWAELGLGHGEVAAGEQELAEIVRWRRDHQPGGQNAGSVFRNPPGASAGSLIEEAGCKGLRVGTAQVSVKHANFIQVDPDGRAADVLAVMAEVRNRVAAHHGVDLVAETHLLGVAAVEAEAAGVPESGRWPR